MFLLLSLPSWLYGKKFAFFFFFFFCRGRTVFYSLILAAKLEIITKNQRLAPKMESKGRIMSEHNEKWKAEEAIGGNRAAVEALRELITFPLLYSSQAQKLGLKVSCNLQSFFILIYLLLLLISGFFFSFPSVASRPSLIWSTGHRQGTTLIFIKLKSTLRKKIDLWFYFINSVFLQC